MNQRKLLALDNPETFVPDIVQALVDLYRQRHPPPPPKTRLFFDPFDRDQLQRVTVSAAMSFDREYTITKVLAANETGLPTHYNAILIVTTRDGHHWVLDWTALNVVRTACSAMAALRLAGISGGDRIGLFGTGRINRCVLRHLRTILGVENVVLVNRSITGLNLAYEDAVACGLSVEMGRKHLRHVTALVTCTTNCDPRLMLSVQDAPDCWVAIALDIGSSLDASWRMLPAYSDFPEGLEEASAGEFWDGMGAPVYFQPLGYGSFGTHPKQVAYLYGSPYVDLTTVHTAFAGVWS